MGNGVPDVKEFKLSSTYMGLTLRCAPVQVGLRGIMDAVLERMCCKPEYQLRGQILNVHDPFHWIGRTQNRINVDYNAVGVALEDVGRLERPNVNPCGTLPPLVFF